MFDPAVKLVVTAGTCISTVRPQVVLPTTPRLIVLISHRSQVRLLEAASLGSCRGEWWGLLGPQACLDGIGWPGH